MQVTAAFARKSYLHLISLFTPLLIVFLLETAFSDFPGEAFLCLEFTFDSNFGMFIVLKKKLIFINNTNNC